MKKRITLYLLATCAFLVSANVSAQDEKYDAIYLSLTKEYTLNPDGSMDYRYAKELKLQTFRSFQSLYGETFIVYNPTFQKLKINEAVTVLPDGKKIPTPQNAFNEVLPGFAANAPVFNALREMVITHTALERNAVIHLDYTLHTGKEMAPALAANELLAEYEPVKSLLLRIKIPLGTQLFFHVFNADYPPTKSKEGNWEVYTWNLKELPAISGEENQPGTHDPLPRLIFSSAGNRSDVYDFLTSQPAFKFEATDDMKTAIAQWKNEKTEKLDLVLQIQDKVVNDFRLMPVPLKAIGYHCRTAGETWNSNGGNAIEKALLLTTLLKTAGFDATPFSVVPADGFMENVGTLSDIEDFGVKVELKEEGTLWLSATALNAANLVHTQNNKILITITPGAKPGFVKTGTPSLFARYIGTFIVSSDPKLTGECSVSLRGTAYPWFSIVRDKNKVKNSLAGALSGSSLTGSKENSITPEALFQNFTIQTDKPFRKDSNYYYFTLPVMTTGVDAWGIKTLSSKREMPCDLPSLADESYQFTFTLPAGLSLFTPAKKISLSNKAGNFLFEIRQEAGKLIVKRQLKIENTRFSTETYKDLKALMDSWNNPRYRELIFTTSK